MNYNESLTLIHTLVEERHMEAYLYQDLFELEEQHWWHIAKRQLVFEALEQLHISQDEKLLDVGCGTGKNVEAFARVCETHGIDISAEAIKFCTKRGLKNVVQTPHFPEKRLPYKNETFSVITALDVIEHVDDAAVLADMHRVLTKKGHVIITVPALPFLWSTWDEVLHHKRRYTKKTLIQTLEQAGFSVTHCNYVYSFLVLPVLVVRRLKEFVIKLKSKQQVEINDGQEYQSDFKLSSPLVNRVFGALAAVERWLVWRVPLPFGTSLVAVARKKQAK